MCRAIVLAKDGHHDWFRVMISLKTKRAPSHHFDTCPNWTHDETVYWRLMHPLTLVDHPIFLTATARFKDYHSGVCVISHNIHITLEPLNKQCSIEVRRSATRCFLCSRRGRFLKAITPYVQTSWLPPAGCEGCWRVRWQRGYLDTYLLIWLVLSHNHYEFSCYDPSWVGIWDPYKTISQQK